MTPTLAALAGYLLLQFGIGAYVARRLRSEDDYLVAGRSLGWGLGPFTIFATWFGAETVIGAAGTVYSEGVGATSAEPFGYALCLLLMGLLFAAPLWRRGLTTLADLYAQRYSERVAQLAAIVLIPGSLLWAAAQVRAFGQVLTVAAPELNLGVGIGVAALLTIAYTSLGGMLADAITDLLQGGVLMLSLAVLAWAVTDPRPSPCRGWRSRKRGPFRCAAPWWRRSSSRVSSAHARPGSHAAAHCSRRDSTCWWDSFPCSLCCSQADWCQRF
ncbi:MAG: hypothetical protein MUD17_10340 [Gemmatimonadaceae bacterium]|nr:hypothetical protein [Gemmatimonadaceae bacterium]